MTRLRCPSCPLGRFHTADACPERRVHFVYRAFDETGGLLYVGCTVDPWSRFAAHRSQTQWYRLTANVTWTPYPSRSAALEAETAAIRTELPQFNKQHRMESEPEWRRNAFRQGACRLCADSRTAVAHRGVDCLTYARERLREPQDCVEGREHAMRVLERAADKAELAEQRAAAA